MNRNRVTLQGNLDVVSGLGKLEMYGQGDCTVVEFEGGTRFITMESRFWVDPVYYVSVPWGEV